MFTIMLKTGKRKRVVSKFLFKTSLSVIMQK